MSQTQHSGYNQAETKLTFHTKTPESNQNRSTKNSITDTNQILNSKI